MNSPECKASVFFRLKALMVFEHDLTARISNISESEQKERVMSSVFSDTFTSLYLWDNMPLLPGEVFVF